MNDLFRHLSLMGTCLFMIVCPPYQLDDEDAEKASGKKDGKEKVE